MQEKYNLLEQLHGKETEENKKLNEELSVAKNDYNDSQKRIFNLNADKEVFEKSYTRGKATNSSNFLRGGWLVKYTDVSNVEITDTWNFIEKDIYINNKLKFTVTKFFSNGTDFLLKIYNSDSDISYTWILKTIQKDNTLKGIDEKKKDVIMERDPLF